MKQSLISNLALLVVAGTTVPRENPQPDTTTVPREDTPNAPGEGPPDTKNPRRERPDTTTVPREE